MFCVVDALYVENVVLCSVLCRNLNSLKKTLQHNVLGENGKIGCFNRFMTKNIENRQRRD